jgi:hypothetical protein
MPQIREYTNRVQTKGGYSEVKLTGQNVDGGMGKAVQMAGQAVQTVGAALQQREQQKEISDASVKMSEAHSKFTKDYQDELNAGTINSEEFTKKYDEHMAQQSENFSTRAGKDYFTKASASLRAHFVESSYAGQAEIASVKAKENYLSTINNFSAGLMDDPSSLATVSQVHNEYIDNLVKTKSLPFAKAEELRVQGDAEIKKSALRGWINLNPNEAKAQIASGKWDSLGGDTKKQMIGEADNEIRAREIDIERREKQNKKIIERQQKDTQNKFLEKMVSGELTAKDILKSNLDPVGSGSKEQFLNFMEQSNKQKLKTDPAVFTDLFNRVHADDSDPNKIRDENDLNSYLGKGLDLQGLKDLRNEMQGDGTTAGAEESALKKQVMKVAEARLTKRNPMTGISDPYGEEQLQKYQIFFMSEFNKGKKAGKTAQQMLDPDSPDYLGKFIGNYAKTSQQIMQDQVKSMRLQAPAALPDGTIPNQPNKGTKPRLPGESIEAYLKRTKGK